MLRLFIVLVGVLTLSPIQAQEILVNGTTVPGLTVKLIELVDSGARQCDVQYCDSADTNCDGVLDESCPGLVYECVEGGIIAAYVQAAFTGQCTKEPDDCEGLSLGGICKEK